MISISAIKSFKLFLSEGFVLQQSLEVANPGLHVRSFEFESVRFRFTACTNFPPETLEDFLFHLGGPVAETNILRPKLLHCIRTEDLPFVKNQFTQFDEFVQLGTYLIDLGSRSNEVFSSESGELRNISAFSFEFQHMIR
jgi:hypothetical protein